MPREHHTPPPFEPEELERSLDRYLVAGLVFMVLLFGGFVAYTLREPDLRAEAKRDQQATYQDLGASLFADNCASCHGDAGSGGTAPVLDAKEFLSATTDAQMQALIAGGVPGSEMPPWSLDNGGTLTDEQVRQLVTYLRSLEPDAPSVPNWREATSP